MDPQFDPILNEKELAKWLATSCPTLQRHRSNGSGPPFIRLSARRIGYRKSAVEKWIESRTTSPINMAGSARHFDTPAPFDVEARSDASSLAITPGLKAITSPCGRGPNKDDNLPKSDNRTGAKS
jgi:predicted DNA-binding transcriptional regulator AlpA